MSDNKDYKTKRTLCGAMVAVPPFTVLLLWMVYGFSDEALYGVGEYYAQTAMTVATILSVPVLLKYVTRRRCGMRYLTLCLARMAFLMLLALANVLLYFMLHVASFFYLAVIVWLAMMFAMPSPEEKHD